MKLFTRIRSAVNVLLGGGDASERGWITYGGNRYNDVISDKSALTISTYFACIRNIGEDVAKLPFRLIQNEGKKRTPLTDDPLTEVLAVSPNPTMTAFTFWSTMAHWAVGWGNAYAEVVRNGRGDVAALYPIHPSRVAVNVLGDMNVYTVFNDDGSKTQIPASRMFHWMGMSGDGRKGYSVARLMQNTLQVANSAQNYLNTFLSNFGRPAGVLETPQALKPEQRASLAESWQAMYSGPMNAGKTAVLDAGIIYKGISIPMQDMQFLELRRFQKEEIASWFRMPLYKLQDATRAQGWSTLDAQETDYVTSCLLPWLVRAEQEVKRQLMQTYTPNVYAHFETKGLLRGDVKTRMELLRTFRTLGLGTGNELRGFEDMDPIDDPEMDKVYVQGAMMPLGTTGPAPTGAPNAPAPEQPETPANGDANGQAR